ncbi:MAG: protein translocase subunit SecD [Anaerolineae bacterium]|nr:protein translocase subunit SecD [Anaerolineae bacterium]
MRDRNPIILVVIALLGLFSLYVALPIEHPAFLSNLLFWQPAETRSLELRQGLDLQGGLQVLLEADPAAGQTIDAAAMGAAKRIIENRVNGLGVSEPLVQLQGDRRIIVELPGLTNPEQAIATLKGTGLLEFIHAGTEVLEPGTVVRTTYDSGTITPTLPVSPTPSLTVTPTATITGTAETTPTVPTPEGPVYETILTGRDLRSANVSTSSTTNQPVIVFQLTSEGATKFAEYTRSHVGQILAITMDKVVLSAPSIREPILDGNGEIEGRFTLAEARSLAVQMQYGALPVALRVIDTSSIGATLGQDSVQRSVVAGLVGLGIVLFFMVVYYRLPGALAALALILYALFNLAIYKLFPVTLTLPGIAGFLLSTGTAVDANVLIFERIKEELRAGKSLGNAIETGFDRAWTSIRDSNLSTIITCVILYWFGSNFGASIVKGFAITLFLGVLLSMFTAITVTRTFMRSVFRVAGERLRQTRWLLPI